MIELINSFLVKIIDFISSDLTPVFLNKDDSVNIVIYMLLNTTFRAINDSIIHHNAYKNFGYFFSKEAAEAPKKNWFHKYFPMCYDFWHLGIVLQTLCTIEIVFIATQSIIFVAAILVARGLLFNIVYK